MAKPKMIGTVNGFIYSRAWLGNKQFGFDGTTRGLVQSAIKIGASDGSAIKANFGGSSKAGARDMTIVSAPHDGRAGGFWAQ